ncbi:GntR family transcriptional regulator [Marinimicrobium sp. ARAG 43.8]|uniref:GntR family transcriptional regulator n=1 Tax=Marinimicrobium sp. ARAG 43.8 TaxID=3418719 RepID=UPI003CEFAFEB
MTDNTQESLFSRLFSEPGSVYTRLLEDIAQGVFVSGDRLVTTALAQRYDTSINPVREALKQLQGEGLVSFQRNSGARVTHFEYTTMRDVYELLQLLEPYLLDWFIEEHTEAPLARLEALLEEMKALTTKDVDRFKELDTLFHWEMYRHHYNRDVVDLWKRQRLRLLALHANMPISDSRIQTAIQEHDAIIGPLRRRDKAAARAALIQHIHNGGDYWSRQVRSRL